MCTQKNSLILAAAMVLALVGGASKTSASVVIDDWADAFNSPDTGPSAEIVLTDPASGASTTMTVAVVSGDSLAWAQKLGINGGANGNNFDAEEALSFTWDMPVSLVSVTLFRGANEEMQVSSSSFSDYWAVGNVIAGPGVTIPANTPVVLTAGDGTNVAGAGPASYRLRGAEFEVVPEPASMALIGFCGLSLLMKRRRR